MSQSGHRRLVEKTLFVSVLFSVLSKFFPKKVRTFPLVSVLTFDADDLLEGMNDLNKIGLRRSMAPAAQVC